MSSILPDGSDSKSEPPAGMKPGDIVLVDLEHGSMIGTALIVGVIYVYVADGNGTCEWYSRSAVSEYVEPDNPDRKTAPRERVARWLFDFTMRHKGSGARWSDDLTVSDLSDDLIRRAWRSEADLLLDEIDGEASLVCINPHTHPVSLATAAKVLNNADRWADRAQAAEEALRRVEDRLESLERFGNHHAVQSNEVRVQWMAWQHAGIARGYRAAVDEIRAALSGDA